MNNPLLNYAVKRAQRYSFPPKLNTQCYTAPLETKDIKSVVEVLQLAYDAAISIQDEYIERGIPLYDPILKEKTLETVSYLSNICNASIQVNNRIVEQLQEKKITLENQKAEIFNHIQSTNQAIRELQVELASLSQDIMETDQLISQYSQDANQAQRELDDYQSKAELLKKWCWVPGYNIYLLIDAEKAQNHLGTIMQQLRYARNRLNELQQQKYRLELRLLEVAKVNSEKQVSVKELDGRITDCIGGINELTPTILQFSELTVHFGKIAVLLDNASVLVKDVLTVLRNLKTELEETT